MGTWAEEITHFVSMCVPKSRVIFGWFFGGNPPELRRYQQSAQELQGLSGRIPCLTPDECESNLGQHRRTALRHPR